RLRLSRKSQGYTAPYTSRQEDFETDMRCKRCFACTASTVPCLTVRPTCWTRRRRNPCVSPIIITAGISDLRRSPQQHSPIRTYRLTIDQRRNLHIKLICPADCALTDIRANRRLIAHAVSGKEVARVIKDADLIGDIRRVDRIPIERRAAVGQT